MLRFALVEEDPGLPFSLSAFVELFVPRHTRPLLGVPDAVDCGCSVGILGITDLLVPTVSTCRHETWICRTPSVSGNDTVDIGLHVLLRCCTRDSTGTMNIAPFEAFCIVDSLSGVILGIEGRFVWHGNDISVMTIWNRDRAVKLHSRRLWGSWKPTTLFHVTVRNRSEELSKRIILLVELDNIGELPAITGHCSEDIGFGWIAFHIVNDREVFFLRSYFCNIPSLTCSRAAVNLLGSLCGRFLLLVSIS